MAETRLVDAAIAAPALGIALGERRHDLVGDLLVLQSRDQSPPRSEPAMLAEGDKALHHGAQILRLRQGGGDLFVLQERVAEIIEHGLAMSRGAAEAAASQTVTHGRALNRVLRGASPAPRCS